MAQCGICYEALWGGGGGRAPQELPCRHSLCLRCLRRAAAAAFISCPFCRTVALLPEGAPGAMPALGALPGDEDEEEEEEGSGAPPARPVAVEVALAAHGPVFAVSGAVSPCGPEASGAFVLGLPGRGLLRDTHPPPASMETLRLGLAAGILVLMVCTFFLLLFLKQVRTGTAAPAGPPRPPGRTQRRLRDVSGHGGLRTSRVQRGLRGRRTGGAPRTGPEHQSP